MNQEPRGGDSRFTRPCTTAGHEVTRSFGEAKDGVVECSCICWTCLDDYDEKLEVAHSWVELWKFDRVVKENEPPLK